MGKHAKTVKLLEVAVEVLTAQPLMTVRQAYYQLVFRHVIENNRGQYQAVSNALVEVRKDGIIRWDWIEDRLRRPREVLMWDDLAERGNSAVWSDRRNMWPTQPGYLEVWLAKDAWCAPAARSMSCCQRRGGGPMSFEHRLQRL